MLYPHLLDTIRSPFGNGAIKTIAIPSIKSIHILPGVQIVHRCLGNLRVRACATGVNVEAPEHERSKYECARQHRV